MEKTYEQIKLSSIAIYLFDAHEITPNELKQIVTDITPHLHNSQLILVANKIDKEDMRYTYKEFEEFKDMLFISAKERIGIDELKAQLVHLFDSRTVNITETIVTNARHVEALRHTNVALIKVLDGLAHHVTGGFPGHGHSHQPCTTWEKSPVRFQVMIYWQIFSAGFVSESSVHKSKLLKNLLNVYHPLNKSYCYISLIILMTIGNFIPN